MKELAVATNKTAPDACKVINDVLNQIKNAKDNIFSQWGVTFADKPKEIES